MQRLSTGTGIEIVLLIIEEGRPGNSAQGRRGTGHWPDIKADAVIAVHRLMGQIVRTFWLSGTVQVP